MKIRKIINEVEEKGFFSIFDIIIYVLVAVLIATLFIVFVNKKQTDYNKIVFENGNQKIFEFSFDTKTYIINDNWVLKIVVTDYETYLSVNVFTDYEQTKYNLVFINYEDKSVYVKDSNCSLHKDCVHTKKITSGGDTIICMPHNLKIYAVSSSIVEPVVG